jgi:MFS family permease
MRASIPSPSRKILLAFELEISDFYIHMKGIGYRIQTIYWGWYVVLGAFLILVLTYGARYSFGVFVRPMFIEYGWPMSVISLAASINVLTYAVFGVFCGRLVDNIAPKWLMTAGSIVTALGFYCLIHAKTPLGLYLSYGFLCGIGNACNGAVVGSAAVGKWFIRKRGMAMGFTTMGIGVGTMVMNPVAAYIVAHFDWRTGFIFFGALIFVFGILISQLLMGKNAPEDIGLLPDGNAALPGHAASEAMPLPKKITLKPVMKDFRFWLLAICNGLAVVTVMMTFVHQVAYAISQNIGRVEAAAALGIVGLSSSCGKFIFGWLCDRLTDAKYAASIGFLMMALGMLFLLKADAVYRLYLSSMVYGFGYGSMSPVMPYLISNRFGRHILGTAFGALVFFVAGIGGSIGPALGGWIFDRTGSYSSAWAFNAVVLAVVSILILFLKPAKKLQT